MTTTDLPASSPYLTPKGRDLRIDLLRGFFVLAMVVDHVAGASPLWFLTGGNRFFSGAAEGFVLTSGLVAGLVYGRLINRDGLGRSLLKALTRALKLYLLTLGLTLTFLPLSEMLHLPWAQGIDTRGPIGLIVNILTLHQTYHLVDVMLLYTVLFLLAPLAFVLLQQGKRRWLLGVSWLLWGIYQLWPNAATLPWPIAGNFLFSFSAWQVIFFTGLALGFGRRALPTPRPRTARLLLVASGVAFAGLIALYAVYTRHTAAAGDGHTLSALVESLFLDKVNVRAGRLLATGVTFSFLFLAVTVFWRPVQRALGWLLMPLGQNALYAYTAHVPLAALAALALVPFKLTGGAPQWLNALVQAGSVALIWVLVRRRFLAPTPRTQRLYNLSPILFAALASIALFAMQPQAQPALKAAALLDTSLTVNRFGTPLPPAGGAVPASTPAPVSAPAPVPIRVDQASALARVALWVGDLRGTLEERTFFSPALGRPMPYWVYLPAGYETSGASYPVVYLLHGAGGHRDEWISYGAVRVADEMMAKGEIAPMILIMPQGDQGFWVNNVGGLRWGDYVVHDLVEQVDDTLLTLPTPQSRAIGGLSMGGYGALSLALNYPGAFGVVAANSPSLHTISKDVPFLGTGADFAARDPLALASNAPGIEHLRIWIDIDAQDPWLSRAQQVHDNLAARGIGLEWHIFPGAHVGAYWIAHVGDYLRFYSAALAHP